MAMGHGHGHGHGHGSFHISYPAPSFLLGPAGFLPHSFWDPDSRGAFCHFHALLHSLGCAPAGAAWPSRRPPSLLQFYMGCVARNDRLVIASVLHIRLGCIARRVACMPNMPSRPDCRDICSQTPPSLLHGVPSWGDLFINFSSSSFARGRRACCQPPRFLPICRSVLLLHRLGSRSGVAFFHFSAPPPSDLLCCKTTG